MMLWLCEISICTDFLSFYLWNVTTCSRCNCLCFLFWVRRFNEIRVTIWNIIKTKSAHRTWFCPTSSRRIFNSQYSLWGLTRLPNWNIRLFSNLSWAWTFIIRFDLGGQNSAFFSHRNHLGDRLTYRDLTPTFHVGQKHEFLFKGSSRVRKKKKCFVVGVKAGITRQSNAGQFPVNWSDFF